MLFTFLKIALRHYGKHRLYALLNLLGLATAYLTVFLIGQYLYVETHYEHAHPNADRIYRITHHDATENGFDTHWARTYLDFINNLPEAIPEISRLIRFHHHQKRYLRIGTEKFRPKHSYLTDPEVFEVFGFELLAGDPQRALAEPFGLVLTESMARRYFGDEDPSRGLVSRAIAESRSDPVGVSAGTRSGGSASSAVLAAASPPGRIAVCYCVFADG